MRYKLDIYLDEALLTVFELLVLWFLRGTVS